MSSIFSLEWGQTELRGVEGHLVGGTLRVARFFEVSVSGDLDLVAQPGRAGAWLKQQLAEKGISAGEVIVVLPRDAVVMRHVTVPDVSDGELPTLVTMQAGLKSSLPAGQICVDFIPGRRESEGTGRKVLLATFERKNLSAIQSCMEAAGLKLRGVTLSPIGAAEVVARADAGWKRDADSPVLIVSYHGSRTEMSVFQGRRMIFSHSFPLSGESRAADIRTIVSQTVRSLIAAGELNESQPIERLFLLLNEDEFPGLAEGLSERLEIEVIAVDPLGGMTTEASEFREMNRAPFAGLAGCLLSRSNAVVETIDFLAPRRAKEKPDYRKRNAIAAVVAVLLAATGFSWYYFTGISSREEEIVQLNERIKKSQKMVDEGEPILKAGTAVREWDERRLDWLEEYKAFAQELPKTDRVFLKSLVLDLRSRQAKGRVELEGYARERKDVMQLRKTLAMKPRYELIEKGTKPSKDVPHYGWELDINVLLKEPLVAGGVAEKSEKPPQKSDKPGDSQEKKTDEDQAAEKDVQPAAGKKDPQSGGGK